MVKEKKKGIGLGMILLIVGVVLFLAPSFFQGGTDGGGNGGGNGGGGGNGNENVKMVTCKVIVFNPRLSDDFEITSATCDSQLFNKCGGSKPQSIAQPLLIFDSDDVGVKLTIGAYTVTKTLSVEDSEITGDRTETITFAPICAKLSTNQGIIQIFDARNGQQTDERGVDF